MLYIYTRGKRRHITAYWRGFQEYHGLGKTTKLPHMFGLQAEGAAPLVIGAPVEHPETVATAIRMWQSRVWQGAIQATSNSEGPFVRLVMKKFSPRNHFLPPTKEFFVNQRRLHQWQVCLSTALRLRSRQAPIKCMRAHWSRTQRPRHNLGCHRTARCG